MADVRWVYRFVSIWIIFVLPFLIDGERTSNKIYDTLVADMPCFRKLDATRQIGCGSERSGNVGIIHYVANVTDLEWLLDHGLYYPYIAVIDMIYFNRKNLIKMQESKKISGVIVVSPLNSTGPDVGHSPDQTCPNRQYGVYNECSEWNPYGDGLYFEDWKFPIFLVQNQEDIDNLNINCYQKFNAPLDGKARTWPLCAAQLVSNMYAAKDAPTCMRRSSMITNMNPIRVCDPLSDANIWSSLIPLNKSSTPANRSLILVAARMDSFSMFENIGPGGDSAVSGTVALLATAQALSSISKELEERNITKNVLFMLFQGEAFDYIGSSRVVYDMSKGVFPSHLDNSIPSQPPLLSLANIGYFIEFNQVGLGNATNATVWAHSDPLSTSKYPDVNTTVNDLVSSMKNESQKLGLKVERVPDSTQLPPASFQRFLKEDSEIPGIVLTDHPKRYTNRYYNSIFDGKGMKGSDKASSAAYIEQIASMAARTIFKLLTNEERSTLTPKQGLVSDMLDCYLNAGNCTLFNAISTEDQRKLLKTKNNTNLYVSVNGNPNGMRVMTFQLMAYLVGSEQENFTENLCIPPTNNSIFTYAWMPGPDVNGTRRGLCMKSTVNTTIALSPAFIIHDYSYSSGMYSTWTESVWEGFSLRIFLKPSLHQEVVTLCIGVLVLLLSFGSVWFLERSSDILFTNTRIITGGS